MKRLGPEIKLPKFKRPSLKRPSAAGPNVKVPPFAADVYYDLRDRRLLPLVALVIVAIAAVPFLLGGSEETVPLPTTSPSAEETAELEAVSDGTLTVVQAKPGLRDYRKRLRGRTPTDPFRQKYTDLPGSAQLQSTVETTPVGSGAEDSTEVSVTEEGGDVTVEVDEPGSSGGGGSPGHGGSGSSGPRDAPEAATDGLQFYAYRPDVRFGLAGSEKLKEYPDLPLTSLLPKEDPVLIFLGITEDGSRAVFDVSPEAIFVKGDGKCIGGRQSCGLLFMRAGDAVTVLTETAGRTFRLAVDSIEFVKVDPKPSARSSVAGESQVPGYSQNFSK